MIGTLDILTLQERNQWLEELHKLPALQQDIYLHPDYARLYEYLGEGEAQCAIYRQEGDTVFYVYLKRDIRQLAFAVQLDYLDLTTPYGYGGPVVFTKIRPVSEVVSQFSKAFHDFCLSNSVVSEFVRFHPLLNNAVKGVGYDILFRNHTVVVHTAQSPEAIWSQMTSSHRRAVKKARRSGLRIRITPAYEHPSGYAAFLKLYQQTMRAVNAQPYYILNDEYFAGLLALKQHTVLATAGLEGHIIAAAIFLSYAPYLHYHLGGSDRERLSHRPNNLLFWEVIQWAHSHNYQFLHLGGGYRLGDGLERFKRGFAPTQAKFFTGQRVHNPSAYIKLLSLRKTYDPGPLKPDYFPAYRA